MGNEYTEEEIKKMEFSGTLRSDHFIGEWLDDSKMEGYGIFDCCDGEIIEFGDFSESGEVDDREDAGDLIFRGDVEYFEIVE